MMMQMVLMVSRYTLMMGHNVMFMLIDWTISERSHELSPSKSNQ